MYEKVNPSHPDKVADRIAGAIVDLAYSKREGNTDRPRVAIEVLIGHGECKIIGESSVTLSELGQDSIAGIVRRITGDESIRLNCTITPQDRHLAENQLNRIKCGDNGIFLGMPYTPEERLLSDFAAEMYRIFPTDGKFIHEELDGERLVICQSNAEEMYIKEFLDKNYHDSFQSVVINPLGYWTGGTDVDTGATNRKLSSDMGRAVTGGGLHGKDLSKADVSVNIFCHIEANKYHMPVKAACAIGDDLVRVAYGNDSKDRKLVPYTEIVAVASEYIGQCGGFERFAEWGLI